MEEKDFMTEKVIIRKSMGLSKSGYSLDTENVIIEKACGVTIIAPNGQEYIVHTNEDGGIFVFATCHNENKGFVDIKGVNIRMVETSSLTITPILHEE